MSDQEEHGPGFVHEPLLDLLLALSSVDSLSTRMDKAHELCALVHDILERLTPEFRIAVIAPLPEEWLAIRHVAEKVEIEGLFSYDTRDRNVYAVMHFPGRPDPTSNGNATHHVLVVQPAKPGIGSAHNLANDVLITYPSIREIILVGIAGGIPWPEVPAMDIRLGDIVVGRDGIIKHDVQAVIDGKVEWKSGLREPSIVMQKLITALNNKIASHSYDWEQPMSQNLDARYQRPDDDLDILRDFAQTPPVVVQRASRSPDRRGRSAIHYGRIGSGDTVLMDAKVRDRLRSELRICAIETESAGVADALDGRSAVGVLAIRGVSDYADPDKYDREPWRGYAVCSAARYLRALLQGIQPNLQR